VHKSILAVLLGLSLFSLPWAARAGVPQVRVLTASGDTAFYAEPGDTVRAEVHVDSGDESLTGLELFLGVDARTFQVLDTSEEAGVQPAEAAGMLGDVLLNALLEPADTLDVIHFAETDLSGKPVAGALLAFRLRVLDRYSGRLPIGAYRDTSSRQLSRFSVPNVAGVTQELTGIAPLFFADLPPELTLPDSLLTDEDTALSVALDPFVTDETPSALLAWEVASPDSLAAAAVSDARVLSVVPVKDYHGALTVTLVAVDAAGGRTEAALAVRVLPVNDPPRVVADVLPDTVLLEDRSLSLTLSGAAVDVDNGAEQLTWSGRGSDSVSVAVSGAQAVFSAPSRWTGAQDVLLTVADLSGASDTLSVTVVRNTEVPGLTGDFDGNDRVEFADFLAFAPHYGAQSGEAGFDAVFDLNADLRIDFLDFLAFAKVYGGGG
jgi:hypothetical protein